MPLRLRIVSDNRKSLGEDCAREFVACGGTIGRNLDSDWVLPDAKRYVSGRHALIDFQAGAYYIVDTSRNGVYINGSETPVGRGHPQRLFDGDQLRIGEFDILIELTDDEFGVADDGMRDSIVRAQLVDEDESEELALIDEDKFVGRDELSAHLATDESSKIARKPVASSPPRAGRDGSSGAAILLRAAGLKAEDMVGVPPSEILAASGKLLRIMVGGLMDLLHDRARIKESFRLSQTIIRSEPNNPLKFSPGVGDALRYLLGNRGEKYLPADEAVQHVLHDIKTHEKAVVNAMLQALQDYVERFDPEELRSQYDRGLRRTSLLAGANKLKYWDLYEESYQVLTQHNDGKLPEEFSKEFSRAYEEEVARSKKLGEPGHR